MSAAETDARLVQALEQAADALALVRDYEHRISWDTTCQTCASTLDFCIRETDRADGAETAIEQVRALHTVVVDQDDDTDWCFLCCEAWPCRTVRLLPEVTP